MTVINPLRGTEQAWEDVFGGQPETREDVERLRAELAQVKAAMWQEIGRSSAAVWQLELLAVALDTVPEFVGIAERVRGIAERLAGRGGEVAWK